LDDASSKWLVGRSVVFKREERMSLVGLLVLVLIVLVVLALIGRRRVF
jgi:hypothetical protein